MYPLNNVLQNYLSLSTNAKRKIYKLNKHLDKRMLIACIPNDNHTHKLVK